MGCGQGICYSTNPTAAVLSTTAVTTDSAGHTVTSQITYTTTITPAPAATTAGMPGAIPKFVATTLSKVPAVQTTESNSSTGLSPAALGGIVASVVVILIAVIVAALIIVRRLRRTEKAVEVSKRGSSNGQQTTSSHKQGYASATVTEVDCDNIDPMATPSLRPSHIRGGSDSSVGGRYSSPARSPPLSDGRETPESGWQGRLTGQYNPIPHSEVDGARHPSMESVGGQPDYTRYSQSQGPHRVSYDSQSTWTHRPGRRSNASELEDQHGTSELDAIDTLGRRRSSGTSRPTGGSRRQSSDSAYRGRSESAAAGTIAPLEAVNEVAELHGYYGPQDKQVGQTAARPTSTGGPTPGP